MFAAEEPIRGCGDHSGYGKDQNEGIGGKTHSEINEMVLRRSRVGSARYPRLAQQREIRYRAQHNAEEARQEQCRPMNLFTTMRGALLALFALAGCAAPLQLLSRIPTSVETLDGNYRTLSACTIDQLARRQNRTRRTDVPDQAIVRISPDNGEWELSFINEDAGQSTRVEMKSPGTQASDYALAIARACAA